MLTSTSADCGRDRDDSGGPGESQGGRVRLLYIKGNGYWMGDDDDTETDHRRGAKSSSHKIVLVVFSF